VNPWWSWALTLAGLTCFLLAGRKVWWAWRREHRSGTTEPVDEGWGDVVDLGVLWAALTPEQRAEARAGAVFVEWPAEPTRETT
jgi:hypothetical protein